MSVSSPKSQLRPSACPRFPPPWPGFWLRPSACPHALRDQPRPMPARIHILLQLHHQHLLQLHHHLHLLSMYKMGKDRQFSYMDIVLLNFWNQEDWKILCITNLPSFLCFIKFTSTIYPSHSGILLISSASNRFAKIGPLRNLKLRSSLPSSVDKMVVPAMS